MGKKIGVWAVTFAKCPRCLKSTPLISANTMKCCVVCVLVQMELSKEGGRKSAMYSSHPSGHIWTLPRRGTSPWGIWGTRWREKGGALRVKRSSGRGADSAQEHFQPPQRVVGGRSVSQSATMGSSQWLHGTGAAVGSGDERALRGQRLEKSREVGRRRNNFVVDLCLRDTFNFRCGINSVGLRRKDSKGVLQTSCP